jgi:hypothetical protein
MKHFVLQDPALKPFAQRFVWVAIDIENPTNAELLKRLPVRTWPTFFILSPQDQAVQSVHYGAASVQQFRDFLIKGEANVRQRRTPGGRGRTEEVLALIKNGERAALAQNYSEAEAAYSQALARLGSDGERLTSVALALISTRSAAQRWEECVNLGLSHGPQTVNNTTAVDFLAVANECASHLPTPHGKKKHLLDLSLTRLTAVLQESKGALSVDDRSEALRLLREVHLAQGNSEAAMTLAQEQRALLDRAAAQASSDAMASTFSWPRAEVYVYLGQGRALIPALGALERALSDQYDPPYRVAWTYHQIGEQPKALAAAERALHLAYGPRKARIYGLIAQIHRARKDEPAEILALEAMVKIYAALPDGQKRPNDEKLAREELLRRRGKNKKG